jgi:hypothetical protein
MDGRKKMQTEWGEMGGEGASSVWELILGLLLFAVLYWGIVGLLIWLCGG